MLTNKLQAIWLELQELTNKVNKQTTNYMARTTMLTNKLQTIWLELLDVNKQTTNYMARTTRC